MWEENNLGGYTQNNEEPTGPLQDLLKINQNIGNTISKGGARILDVYDQVEQEVLPMRRPAIQKSSDWIDNNLTSLLKHAGVKESWAEKSGDVAGVTTNILGEVFAPGLEETAAATLTAGAALTPIPGDEALGALGTAGLYGKGVITRGIEQVNKLPDYKRIISDIIDGRWTIRNGKRTLVTPEGVEINANNINDINANPNVMQSTTRGGGSGPTFVKRPDFGSPEEALTAGYGGQAFERLMKSKRHLKLYGDNSEEAAAFMQRGWNHFAVNNTLRGMEGGRYITLSNGQVLKLRTNTAASKINIEKMTGLSLKNDLAQEAYNIKRNLGEQFDIPRLEAFANKSGYPPEAVRAYIKAAKEHNKKLDELVKYLNKKGGSVMWSKGHYRAVENLLQMGTGDKGSANMITNVFLQKLSPNAKMQAKKDLPHLLNLASNRAFSIEEDFLKFVEPELFGSFWPKLTGKYKTVFIDRVLDDMQRAGGKGIDIRDIVEENVNLILEDTNLIETMGRIKFDANKVYPWLEKHGVNIKANFNVK